jgi:hypothetical protein
MRLLALFKLLRVPRLFGLLNVERFKQSITTHFTKQLEEKVKNNIECENYPILKQLMWVQFYKIVRLVLIIFTFSYFLGILWHILVVDVMPPKDMYDTNNFYMQFLASETEWEEGLDLANYDRMKRLVKVWYFAFTTLSTIGFGDFSP